METLQSQILFIPHLHNVFYILFRPILNVQIDLVTYGEKSRGWGRRKEVSGVRLRQRDDGARVNPAAGDHRQESFSLIHGTVEHQGISPPHYEMCLAKAHAAVRLLLESLCLSTTLSSSRPLYRFHIGSGKQCHASFIEDASPTGLNPSSLKRESWAIFKFL